MKHLSTLVLFICLVGQAAAQCNPRYHHKIFADSIVSDVQYGSNTNVGGTSEDLFLDIHFPQGDVETSRPLIIMAHGGNFLGGDKAGTDVLPLCGDLASMGFVVASINYRVGMNNFPFPGPDSTDAAETVIRASHDAKAAVRFFRESFESNGNPYGIDTSNIFFAGVSAGGFMALNVGYFNDPSEYPTFVDTVGQPGLTGGLEGASGSPGYSSKVKGVINICGAIRDTAWMDAGEPGVINFHGDVDQTVPYGSQEITLLGVYPLLQVDGSHSVDAKANELGLVHCFETHEGQDHVPHMDNGPYYDTTLNLMRNFLVHYVCNEALDCSYGPVITDVPTLTQAEPLFIYPNPAADYFMVDLPSHGNAIVELSDVHGRLINTQNLREGEMEVERPAEMSPGLYFVKVTQGGHVYTTKVLFE